MAFCSVTGGVRLARIGLLALLAAGGSTQAICGPPPPIRSLEQRLAEPGLADLAKGDFLKASSDFQVALQSEPRSASLHFLTGLAYHLRARTEGSEQDVLAEMALRTSLRLDPAHAVAWRELGRVLAAGQKFEEAEAAFGRAYHYGLRDASTVGGLAFSAYSAVDHPVAAWAAAQLDDASPETWRLRALIHAQGGDAKAAASDVDRYRQSGAPPARVQSLTKAQGTWREMAVDVALQSPGPSFSGAQPPMGLGPSVMVAAAPQTAAPAIAAQPYAPVSAPGGTPVAADWSDCQQRQNVSVSAPAAFASVPAAVAGSVPFADETTSLTALPSPCQGHPLPRMAMIDVVIIRTIINGSSMHGLNFLDALSVVLGAQIVSTRTENNANALPVANLLSKDFRIGLPLAGIQYSLNLANATGVRSEVLSRPSLLALDRQPSAFFSGSTLTVGLPGQISGGSLGQIPVGTSLSVTPTFVDNDTMLLSTKASRSFFEGAGGGSFGQQVQTSRNTVTSNVIVDFGQTVVLSGLSERETQTALSETPGLGKTPLLQYFFKHSSDQDFRTQLIILLTPRRHADGQDDTNDKISDNSAEELKLLRAKANSAFSPIPNLEAIKYHLRTNRMYRIISGGTLEDDMWTGSSERFTLVNELRELLFF